MTYLILSIFLLSSISLGYFVEAGFPKCDDILQATGGGKPQCYFCAASRMKDKCKDACESTGCNKILNEVETSHSSSSSSNSNSNSSSSSSSSSSSNAESKSQSKSQRSNDNSESETSNTEESGSGSSKSGSGKGAKAGKSKAGKGKGKAKSGSGKGKGNGKGHKGKSSSSSSNQESSSSNQESSSSNQESSSSSNNQASSSSSSSKSESSSSSSGSGGGGGGDSSKCDGIEPCVPMDQANEKYMACCKDIKGIKDSCIEKCKYSVSKQELVHAFTHKVCDLSLSREVLACAANHKDNAACCKIKHVFDNGRDFCEPFCNPASEAWPKKAEARHLKCLAQFDILMKCHYASTTP